ncbi:MAG TPA: hypothetical protein VGM86_33130 [Thermoanaerobaculia bacterium]|jgi:hypothetical protein
MSKVALADAQKEWAEILDGLDTVAGLDKPDLREMREELAAMVVAVRELRADQADLEARRQSITQQLRITRTKAPRPERRHNGPGSRQPESEHRPSRPRSGPACLKAGRRCRRAGGGGRLDLGE